ncbi:hypothetical protein ASD19_06685 [Microbacterium sp. Root53]|nr:hypothetical protein ASD19_06685 [Microbacterium sp. Root53]
MVVISTACALLLILLAVAWLGFRVLSVRSELTAARGVVAQVQAGADVDGSLDALGGHGEAAAAAAADPIWRAAEVVPFVGPNLRAVRLASESLDVLANDLGRPAMAAVGADSADPVFARVLPILAEAEPRLTQLAGDLEAVRGDESLVGDVRDGVDTVAPLLSGAAEALPVVSELLGANGPRNYLLVSQNNAEAVGLGGSAASQTLLRADAGRIEIVGQANSRLYRNSQKVPVEVPDSALALYSDYLVHHINTSSSRPDFPTMAQIVAAWWQRDIAPDQIDGVISIDPIALSYVLRATGPVQLATGEELNEGNAVRLLLNEIYVRWGSYQEAPLVDAFFASAATSIFDALTRGDFDPMAMVSALNDGIENGSIMFWSAHEEVQQTIAPLRVAGILPDDNADSTTIGVYYRDESMSKIDYYMKSAVGVEESCVDGVRSFAVSSTLHMDISQTEADLLPQYIASGHWGSQQFRTQVYIYGPPGTTVESVTVNGRDVHVARTDVQDLGRPVAWFTTNLVPTERASVTAVFSGEDGDYGPVDIRSTPMINKTGTELATEGCAAR